MKYVCSTKGKREKIRTLQVRLRDYVPSNFETPFCLKLFNPPDGSGVSGYDISMLEKIVRKLDEKDSDIIQLA